MKSLHLTLIFLTSFFISTNAADLIVKQGGTGGA